MTTADVPDTAGLGTPSPSDLQSTPGLRLDDGPLGTAMAEVHRAVADIEKAEEALVAQRRALAVVLGEELRAVLDAEPDDVVEEVRPALRALYWEHADVIRVKDLTDATGLSGAQLRTVVGPRVVDVPCRSCGTPMEVVQRSRSDVQRRWCDACRMPPLPPRPLGFDDTLARLVAHLDAVVERDGCDGQLTQARSWAAAEGIDPDALAMEVRSLGGHCDCEVVLNVWAPRR